MAALLLCFAGTAFSAEKQQLKVFGGTIKAIDTKEKVLTLWNAEVPEFTLTVEEKTISKITSEKKTLADMKIGDIAVVVYEEVNGKIVPKAITVKTP